ncbi:MAG: CinA family protein [Phycisphaerales bacterium]|nr:CinA family protein [Phycisphaerales bacterium]
MNQASAISELVVKLSKLLCEQNRTLATVESCTGGMVGAAIVEPDGASDVYLGGFVTYSNMTKQMTAGVSSETLAQHGAVSSQVAIEMAKGGCAKLLATNSIAITGIAGSGGGSIDKPIGTVWICTATSTGSYDCRRFFFPNDGRTAIRQYALGASLKMCIEQLTGDYHKLEHECERLTA